MNIVFSLHPLLKISKYFHWLLIFVKIPPTALVCQHNGTSNKQTRAKEHWAAYAAKAEDSHILKHWVNHHVGQGEPHFRIDVIKYCRDALSRQGGGQWGLATGDRLSTLKIRKILKWGTANPMNLSKWPCVPIISIKLFVWTGWVDSKHYVKHFM